MYKAIITFPDVIKRKFRYSYYTRNNIYTYIFPDLTTLNNKHVELDGREVLVVESMDNRYDYKLATGELHFKKRFVNIKQEVKIKFNSSRFEKNKEYYLLERQFKLTNVGNGMLSFMSVINPIIYETYYMAEIQQVFDELSKHYLLERFYAFNSLSKTVISRRAVS